MERETFYFLIYDLYIHIHILMKQVFWPIKFLITNQAICIEIFESEQFKSLKI